ncbi:MAG: FliM/FliN family flagellar motor switch protein [Planctomycetaceae bacterium]
MMTTTPAFSNCDFSEPRRLTGGANRALKSWQTSVCALLLENWQGLLGSNLQIALGRIDSATATRAIRALPDPGFAARLTIGASRFDSLFVFSARMVLTLLHDMLGTQTEDWPEIRPMTAVETSMVELLFGEVARSIGQAWPEVQPLECELHSVISRPIRCRLYGPDDILVRTRITMTTAFGEEEAIWLMPQTGLDSIGIRDSTGLAGEHDTPLPAPQLKALAKLMPAQLVVSLGRATLTLAEMNSLKVGDYLPLDQAVYQPLEARVDGRLQWIGNPCRLGGRQGFQIIAANNG